MEQFVLLVAAQLTAVLLLGGLLWAVCVLYGVTKKRKERR